MAPLQKRPQRKSGDLFKELSLAPRRPVEYWAARQICEAIGPRTCRGDGERAEASKQLKLNQRGMSFCGQSAEVWGWLVAAHSRPPVHSGLARAARQSGLLYYPVRGLERAQNFKLLDGALLASDPRSRHSSPSHLGRKVLISDDFSVIRLPRCRVAAFTKKRPREHRAIFSKSYRSRHGALSSIGLRGKFARKSGPGRVAERGRE